MLRQSGRRKPLCAVKFRRCYSGFRTGNLDDSLRPQHGEVFLATVADGGRNSRQTDLPLVSTLDQLALGAAAPDFGVLVGELANWSLLKNAAISTAVNKVLRPSFAGFRSPRLTSM
jgi:hypothetical protein